MNPDHAEWVSELSETYGRMVYCTAYRILGNAEDAEDILQEVFLKMLSGGWGESRQDAVRDWGAYLRVTATRCAIDWLRQSHGKKETGTLIEEIEQPGPCNPRFLASEKQKAQWLRRAIAQLPEREAKIFALRYFEDFSYEEIAAQLDLNTNQVGVTLHRTRERLKQILASCQSNRLSAESSVLQTTLAKENRHEHE